MNRRMFITVVLAAVGLVAVAHAASAQGEPVRIVQTSDGTLYLLKNSAHYAIVSDAIDDEELAMYADGGAIGGSELLSALTAPSPSTALAGPAAVGDTAQTGVSESTAAAQATPAGQPEQQVVSAPAQPQACPSPRVGAKQPACGAPLTSAPVSPHFLPARGPTTAGGTASVSFQAAPATVCSLNYQPPSGSLSSVGDQTADANGVMTWTFPTGNQSGTGSLQAVCGDVSASGSIQIAPSGGARR